MSPIAHVIIEILAGGGLISLCLKLYKDKRRNLENGKIEIKFTETYKEEESINIRHIDLILEIKYRLLGGGTTKKKQP